MVKTAEIVTITNLVPVFKEGSEANAIQVAKFSFEDGGECGFNVIAQKGLYEIGSKAVYIQPDYCLAENELFSSFVAPGGDPKKSRLGKQNRIRAIKFNFSFENSSDPIYSNGILMPLSEAEAFLQDSDPETYCFYSDLPSPKAYRSVYDIEDLAAELGVSKYEEPETAGSGLVAGEFPSFMYKTDEPNINNIVDHVKRVISEGQELGITIKRDGCCDKNVVLQTKDGPMTIGQICDTGYDGLVLSYDIENSEVEYSKIIGHNVKSNNNDWYEIEMEDGTKIKLTGNHRVWIPKLNCYRRVEDLDGSEDFLIK